MEHGNYLTVIELRKRLQDYDETNGYYVNVSSTVITPNDLIGYDSVCLHPIYETDEERESRL